MTRQTQRFALWGATLLCAVAVTAGAVSAQSATDQQKPWTLDANNYQLAKDLLPEVVLNRVKNSEYIYNVVPVDPEKFKELYSKKFWEASEANAGKFDVDQATCGLKDVSTGQMPAYFFGYPFPKIDPKDPQAACKMAWNFESANQMGNGQGATFTLNGIDASGEFKRIKTFLHLNGYLSRSEGALDNPEGLRSVALSSVLEPQDVDGVGGLTKRINDWTSQDKAWFFVPSTRRVRRVNAATRSDPVAGLDIFADDLNCYGGKVEYYEWKVVGEGNILAPVLSPYPFKAKSVSPTRQTIETPYMSAGYEKPGSKGAPWWVQENLSFIPRPVWVVEGKSSDPYYNFGKVIMYFDKEMYRIYWKLVHNRAGEYFYTAMCGYHFVKNDETFSSVFPNLVIGVNDKTNRAALGGRYQSSFLEQKWDPAYFTLRTITHMTD